MLSAAQRSAALSAYPVFAGLSPGGLSTFPHMARYVMATDGQFLFVTDDPCSHYLLVLEGAVRVTHISREGREIVLYRVLPGDSCILTVSCLLGSATYPASGQVEGELSGILVEREFFEHLIATEPDFRRFVFAYFAERMTLLMMLIDGIAFQRLDRRLAGVLLRDGPVLQATHQRLAEELGSVREVVSRILKEFADRELVVLERGQIRVLDCPALAEIADPLRDWSH